MKANQQTIQPIRITRIREQVYPGLLDFQISALSFGNRFAYLGCTTLLLIGVTTSNILLLSTMMLVAYLSSLLPFHVFDYLYNGLFARLMGRPKLPKRSNQIKFTSGIATITIGIVIYLFSNGMMIPGYALGGVSIGVASLVSTIDLCVPSKIYNSLFLGKEERETLVYPHLRLQ